MKRAISIICCVVSTIVLYAEPSAVTLEMLKGASVAEGKEYLNQRNAIIKKATAGKDGEELLGELKDVATDESLSWQIRLMANICVERVEKGDEINELIGYKWVTHPEYEEEWGRLHGGPWAELSPIIIREFKKKKMWFYYLETVWKDTKEYDRSIRKNNRPMFWHGFCQIVLENSPESYYMFRVLEERISKEPGMGKHETQCDYIYIIKHSGQSSFQFILEAWIKRSGKKAGFFEYILPQAKMKDMEYIHEFGKTTKMNAEERAEFNRQMLKLNKKFGLTADGKPISKSTE